MRLFGYGDKRGWLRAEIEKYAEEKIETYKENLRAFDLERFKPIHPLLEPQIEILYRLLENDLQKAIFDIIEYERRATGSVMARGTDHYYNRFAALIIDTVVNQKGFRGAAEKNWQLVQKNIYPYNRDTGQKLRLERWLGIQEDQNVFLVTDPSSSMTKWVMKWESTSDESTENEEAKEYNKLEAMGAQCPKRLNGYYFLNFPVLVIEFLQPLDVTDNAVVLAKQLLTTQLKYIHQYACYFDLKTDNIRKRASNPPLYFIIDMNLSPTALPGGGYKRLHFTPFYTSQTFPRVQGVQGMILSTYKNDFIELLYVVHQMIARRAYESKTHVFDGRLNPYNNFGLEAGDYFADPDRMQQNPIIETARGWKAAKSMLEYPLDTELSPITFDYMRYLTGLPNFPPPNVHEIIASTLGESYYMRFYNQTTTKLPLQCRICSDVSSTFRCGDCYNGSTFLCSEACARQHQCQ
jgi:hypothetical protein